MVLEAAGTCVPDARSRAGEVCFTLSGELTVSTPDDSITMSKHDSVWLDSWETHAVENTGPELAVGLDIFVPARDFDFWLDRQ